MLKKQKKYTFQINNKLEYPAFGINFQVKGKHAQTTRAVDTDLSMVFGKKQTISGSLSLKDTRKKLLSKTGDLTISYPGRTIIISNAFTQTNAKKYTNTLSVQYEKGKQSLMVSAFRISGPTQFDVSSSLRIQDMQPLIFTGKYRPILRNFLADTEVQLGKNKYALTTSSQYKKGQYLQLSTEYECPSRRVSAEIEGSITKPLHTGKLDVKWDVNRDNNKRILLRGDLTLDGINNFAANMIHSGILGQVKMNMKHQGGQTYNSHAAFEWGKKNKISMDSVVSMQDEKSSGTFTLSTPFKGYKQVSIQGSHLADKAQYVSSMDIDWKPMNKISGTVTLKRPFSMNNFDATIDVKSPLEGFERSSIRVAHKYDSKVETLLKTSWNKQNIQLDIFGNNKGNDRRTDLAARINMKSTLDSLTSFYIAARHNGDDRKFETGVNVDYNGNAFSYESEVTHYRSGFQIQNTGRIALQTPWRKAETTWTHRNTNSEIVSNLKIKAGRDNIEINLDARQAMALPQGTLSLKAGMKSPFGILKDVEMAISHEHRPGFIDSSASMKQEGNSILSILNKYRRQNGQATSSHVLSLRGKPMSISTSAKYENYPLTGKIEIALDPETKSSLEGNLDVSSRGLVNGNWNLKTPLVDFEQVSLSFNQDKEGRETVSRTTLQYSRQSVVMETRTQWERKKSVSIAITSPLKNFRKLIAAAEFTGDLRSFHTSANFKLQPIVDKVSLSSQWSSFDGIIANVKLQTPFKQIPYSQIVINSKAQGDKTVTDITFEYLPRKEIKFQSSVRPQLDNLEGMVKISTPFDFLSYTAASLLHTGDRNQFNSKAELEYEAGKKLSGQVSFKNTDKAEGSILIKTPFTNDVSAEFEHSGNANDFVSSAKLQHSLSKKYEVGASYGKRTGTLNIKTPFMDDISAACNYKNNRNGLQSHGEVQYGSQKKYEVDVKYGNLEGSLALKSPITKDMSAAFNHRGGIREFQSHAEFRHGSNKKYEIDAILDKQSGSLLMKSPISEDIVAGYRHNGEIRNFETHVEAGYGRNKKYEGDISFTSNDLTKAQITLKSPVSKDLSAGFMYRINTTHLSSNADAQYGVSKKYETSLTIAMDNKVQGSFSLKTPMTNDVLATYNHEGNFQQFKSHCSVQYSKGKKFQLDTTFSNARKLEGSFFVKTPFTDDVTAAFSHQGDLKKFDTSAELQYAPKKKLQATVNFMNKKKTSGSFALKSPVSPDITASFKHSGDLSQFNTLATVHVNKEKKLSVDADFLNKKRTKGTLKIQSPFTDDITLKIGHKGKRTDFRLDTDLSIGKDKYDSTLSFRSRKDLSVSLLLATPIKGYKKIKTVLTHSGSIKSFKTRGEFSIGKEAVSANMKFTLKPNLVAKLEIETPFKGYKKVTTEVIHQGTIQNFKCNGKISRGKATEFNADIAFSVSPKVSGSVSVQTPFKGFKNTEARFSHAGTLRSFQSQANFVYLNKRQIDLTAKINSESDISADITLATPFEGFERFGVIVSQTGTWKDFTANAELSNASGKKLAAGARFSMINALSGEFTLTTPVQNMETTRMAFSHDGTMNNFRSHAEVLFSKKMSEADVSFSSLSNTEGNVIVKTPMFKTVKTSFSYRDQPKVLNADIEYGKDKILGAEMKLSTSPSVKGEISIKSAFAKDMYASVFHKGSTRNFMTETRLAYGKKLITAENKFNVESDISISSKINTPFVGYERFVGAFSHSGVLSDFRCHIEGSLNKYKIEGDITFTSLGPVEGTVAIRTPFEILKDVQSSFRHVGDMKNFNTHAEALFDGRRTEADISLDTTSRINARASLKDQSIEDIIFNFNHEGSLQRFATHSDVQYSGSKQVEFDVDLNSMKNFVLTTSLRSSCPYLEDIQVDISRKGAMNNFKALSIFNINGKTVSGKFDLDTRTGIDSKATLKTPVSEDIVMSYNHNGNYQNFQCKGYLQFSGSRQYELETNWNKRPSTDSSVTVKTPFRDFSTLRATVKHNDDFNSMKSGVSIQYYKDNVMELSINVQKGDDMKGSALLTAPFLPDLAVTFGHRADMSSFKSMGELKIDNQEQLASSIEYRFGSRRSGSFMVRAISNQLDTAFNHEGNLQNFNSHVEVSLNGEKTSADAKFSNDKQLSGSVQLLSPFQNLKNIGGSFNHKYLDGSLTSNAKLFSSDKSVSGNVIFNNRDVIDGSIIITTPFSGVEITSMEFRHSFVGKEMVSHAKLSYAADKEVRADITFSNKGQMKGSATLKTPFSGFEQTSASFRHTLSSSRLVHHSEISYGRQQKVETDIAASFVSPFSGSMTVKSPFNGFEESKISFELRTNRAGFQGKAVGTFRQESVEGTVQYSGEGPMEGSISIKTPFSGFEETSATFRHDLSSSRLVHHSEISYGRQQKIETDIAASFVSPFSGSMNVKSPFSGFEESKVSFELSTNRAGFRGKAVGTFRQESVEGTVQYSGEGPMEGSIGIKTPFLGFEETSASFRHRFSSTSLQHHAEIVYGRQQKQIETDIEGSFAAPYFGSVTIKTPFLGFEESKALIEFVPNQQSFQGKAKGLFRQQAIEGTVQYSGKGPFQGSISLTTPFKGYETSVASFTHDASSSGFLNKMEIAFKGETAQSTVRFNNAKKVQFSANVRTPFRGLESTTTSFGYTPSKYGFKAQADAMYQKDRYAIDMSYNSESKLEGSVTVKTPFNDYKKTQASFVHSMAGSALNSHADVTFRGDKYESDISFNSQPSLTGTLTIKTPIANYEFSQAEIRHAVTKSTLRSHGEITFGGEKYEGDISFDSQPTLEGSIVVKTPFVKYETSKAAFNYVKTIGSISSHAEIAFAEKKSEIDFTYNNGNKMDASVSLKTPFSGFELTTASLRNDISNNRIDSHAELIYGEQKKIELDVSGGRGSQMKGSIELKTPFKNFETTKYSMKYVPSLNGLAAQADLVYGRKQKISSDVTCSLRDTAFDGSFGFNTPFTKKLSASTSNSLTVDGFSSSTVASYGSKQLEINANLDLSDTIAASASVKTPFKDFEYTAMTLNAVGNIYDFDGKVKLQYSSAQVIAVALKHQMSTEKIESKFTAETPYTDDILVRYEKDGPWTSFTSLTEVSVGQKYSYNMRSAYHSSAGIIDISTTETWTIAGERGSSSMTFKQENSMDSYKTSMSAEYNGDRISAEGELKTTDPLEGSFVLQTPFEYLRDINGKFSHSGELNQFISSAEFQYNNMEKVEAKVDFFRSSWRRLNTNVELKTPFTGMEYTKVHVKHNGNRNGIKCSGEVTYGSNEQITGSLKALKQPMEIEVSVTTPFEGFDKLSTQAKLTTNDDKYVAEASAAKSSDIIDFKSYIEFSSVPITGMVQLNTPFSGFESSKIVISHKGNLKNFQSSVDLQSSSIQDINAAAMLQYYTPFEMDGSITFASGITGAENLKMAMTNRRNGDDISSHVEGSWSPDNAIALDSTLGFMNYNAGKINVMLSTPFEKLRSMNIEASHGYSNQNLKDKLYADLNGKKLIDLDSAFSASDKYTASFELREPHPMSFSAEGRVTDAMKSGFVSLNWDKDTDDSQIRFEGSLNDNSDSYTDKLDMKMKVSCPTRSVGIKGSVERSSDRLATSMDLLNDDESVFGYDMDSSKVSRRNNIQTSRTLKLRCPSRSVQLSGSFGDRYGIKTAEGVLMWDADRDSSKKIGLRTKYIPQGDAVKADFTFEMPSIGEDVKLDSEMTINSGKVLFDSKTEFKYSKDSRKTLVINSRLEDVAFGSNKNYTFSFDLKHIDSSIDIQLKSHVGQTSDRYSAGVDVDYLTAKKNKQIFALMGEIDSLRKQLNVEMRSPIKSVKINGNIKTSAPYSISVQNVHDMESPMNTELTLDPARRSIEFQMNYDSDNVLHMTAKYVNDSAILGEIFRIENSRRITDTLMAIRLNTSRILHSRIHWRPTIIQELKAVGLRRIAIQSNKMNTGFQSVATSVREELNQKYNLIRQSASEGVRPYASFVQQIVAELRDELAKLNQYKDVSTEALSIILTSIDSFMESLKTTSTKDFPMKEQYDFYVEASKELMELTEKETSRYYAGIMDLLEEQFKELGIVLEQAYNKYQDTMSKISGNSAMEFINSNIKKGQEKLSNLDVMGQLSSKADQYTSAIYGAREAINKKMTGPVLVDIKNYGLQTYQMAENAYKFWEIEENMKSVMEAVYQLVREEIEEEFASIKHGLANLKGTKFTVFDVSNGEIQMDTFLPIAMQSLKSLPTVSFNKHYQRMQSYVPNTKRWGSVADYIPDSDMLNWIPPFRASARIEGDHVITFDGKDFEFNGKCGYILARDYVDGNFSVIMTYLGAQKKKLIVMTATQTLQVAPNGKVRVDGKTVAAPYKSAELSVSQDGGLLIIKGSGFQMSYDLTRDSLDLDVSGWYFGKLGGLFGTPNNEKFDDMMMSSRQITNDANSLASAWEVNSKCR